jgi:hypothetical protein
VRRAARGTHDADDGGRPVIDAAEGAELRRQPRGMHERAIALTVAGTAVATMLRAVLEGGC